MVCLAQIIMFFSAAQLWNIPWQWVDSMEKENGRDRRKTWLLDDQANGTQISKKKSSTELSTMECLFHFQNDDTDHDFWSNCPNCENPARFRLRNYCSITGRDIFENSLLICQDLEHLQKKGMVHDIDPPAFTALVDKALHPGLHIRAKF